MTTPDTATQETVKPNLPRVVFDGELSNGTTTRRCRILEDPDDFIFEALTFDALGGRSWLPIAGEGQRCITASLALAKVTGSLTAANRRIEQLLADNLKLREENARLGQAVAAYATPAPHPPQALDDDADKSNPRRPHEPRPASFCDACNTRYNAFVPPAGTPCPSGCTCWRCERENQGGPEGKTSATQWPRERPPGSRAGAEGAA